MTTTFDDIAALVCRVLAAGAGIDEDAGLDPAAPIGSAAIPIGSLAYVQALIAVEDEIGASFADRLFAEVGAATVGDVQRYAAAAAADIEAGVEGSRS